MAINILHVHVGVSKVGVSLEQQDYFVQRDSLLSSFCQGMEQQLPHHHFSINQNQLPHPDVRGSILMHNVNTVNHYTMQQSNSQPSFIQKTLHENLKTRNLPTEYYTPTNALFIYHIHSFNILSDDRSKASSKMMPPYSAIQSLLLQMRISSPVLKVIQ